MRVSTPKQAGLLILWLLLTHQNVLSQSGKYEAAYENKNYIVELSVLPTKEYQIIIDGLKTTFLILKEENFKNAVRELWDVGTKDNQQPKIDSSQTSRLEISEEAFSIITKNWFEQIDRQQFEKRVQSEFEIASQKELIGKLAFRNLNQKAPIIAEIRFSSKSTSKALSADSLKLFKGWKFKAGKSKEKSKKANFRVDSVKVDSIQIAFDDGLITRIVASVKSPENEKLEFKNQTKIPIRIQNDIGNINKEGQNLLKSEADDTVTCLLDLAQVIKFYQNVPSAYGTYIPENGVVRLRERTPEVKLFKSEFFGNFDIRLYTDLTGIGETNPNGLLQTEGSYRFVARTGNYVPLSYIVPFVTFSKIEKKLDALVVNKSIVNEKPFHSASAFDLFRFSYLRAGVNLNFLSHYSNTGKYHVDLSIGIFRTQIDSLIKSVTGTTINYQNRKTVTSWYLMPSFNYHFIDGSHVDGNLICGLIYFELIDDSITLLTNKSRILIPGLEVDWNLIQKYQINLNIHPDPKEQDKSLFLRTTLFMNKPDNNFSFQIGYASPISKLFKSTREKQREITQ